MINNNTNANLMHENLNNKEHRWTVYTHINKNNGKQYIGITSRSVEKRWGVNGSQYTYYKNPVFHKAIKKYGWDNFEHNILFENLTEQEAKDKEKELIKLYHTCVYDTPKNGYNMTFGGEGLLGHMATDETKKKMSKSHLGKNNFWYGKKLSEETRQKMSKSRKGKNIGTENPFYGMKHTKETKDYLSNLAKSRTGEKNPNYGNHKIAGENHPMYGKHLSDETKLKISQSRKGKYGGKNSPNAKRVLCLETNRVYNTIKEAANDLTLDISSIAKCCKGKIKQVKGYHFLYVRKE